MITGRNGLLLRLQQSFEIFRFKRRREQIALADIAAMLAQPAERGFVPDAFRHDLETQVMRKIDRRAHDDLVGFVVGKMRDKGLVDLEVACRNGFQIGKPALAGAVIVYLDSYAHPPYLIKLTADVGWIFHEGAFRHLDVDPVRPDGVAFEHPGQSRRKMVV